MVGRDETLAKIKGEHEKALLKSAETQLKEAGIRIPPNVSLEQALRLLAAQYFENTFNYAFSDKASDVKPRESLGGITPLAALCGITDPTSTQVKDYINTIIIGSVDIPDGIKSQTENDLSKVVEGMLAKPPSHQWYVDKYTKSFDVAPRDERTIKADGVYVYANVPLTRGIAPLTKTATPSTRNTTICVLYHMSVYYEVATEFKILREQQENTVYTSAENFTQKENIDSTAKLRDALRDTLLSKFAHQFNFEYTQTPPKFDGGRASTLIRHDGLKYIQDELETTHDFIETDFFSAVNIGNEVVKNQAKRDISLWFGNIVEGLSEGDWATVAFNHSYSDTSGRGLNKITANIVVALFLDKRKTTKDALLTVTYMYILGMFFEEVATGLILTNSLYRELCKNLKPDIQSYLPPPNPKGDQWELNSMMFQYAKQEFQKSFRFDWAGKNTKPKDDEVLQLIPFSVVIDLEVDGSDPPTKEAIEKRVSLAAFRKDGYEFPWGPKAPQQTLQAWAFDDLVGRIQGFSKEILTLRDILRSDAGNFWHAQSVQQQRPVDFQFDTWLKAHSTFVYAMGKKAAGNEKINRYIVYYLSIFYCVHMEPEGP